MKKLKLIVPALLLSMLLTACGAEDDTQENGDIGEETVNYGEEVDYTIIGIESGSGAMELAEDVLEDYENLAGWEVVEGSTAAMLTELDQAINNEEPIVVIGWNPHYMFAEHDLKYLEDPRDSFVDDDGMHTITRVGLEEDMPEAYEILDRFSWELEVLETLMLEALDTSIEDVANNWVAENQDSVNEWTKGVEPVDGEAIELVLTPWDSERIAGEVLRLVLEEQGYQVTLTPVDIAVMFQAIATGEGDASTSAQLPVAHGTYYEQYQDDIVDLGPSVTNAKIGLTVPEYMDIDSIEDLEPNE